MTTQVQRNGRLRQPTREESAAEEAKYFDLRRRNLSNAQVREILQITERRADVLAGYWHAASRASHIDASSPRFAHHDTYVSACLAQGGFIAFSERRLIRGQVIPSLPIIRPQVAA